MKIVLAMIVCSALYQDCLPPQQIPGTYNTFYDCMIAGYEEYRAQARSNQSDHILASAGKRLILCKGRGSLTLSLLSAVEFSERGPTDL